jgi:hypothetical protein
MLKRIAVILLVVALSLAVAAPALAGGGPPPLDEDGNRVRVIVYVESQGLFYDSIVGPALPPNGPFQELRPGEGPEGTLATDFGPGDPGYVGGRWWIDANGDGEQNEGDAFFSCFLFLPIAREGQCIPADFIAFHGVGAPAGSNRPCWGVYPNLVKTLKSLTAICTSDSLHIHLLRYCFPDLLASTIDHLFA